MFSGWVRHLQLTAKAKIGLSRKVLAFGLIAAICAVTAFILLVAAAFISLEQRYGALTASLVLGGFFILFAVFAALACLIAQRRAAERARLALEARSHSPWIDPSMLTIGLQIARALGRRRVLPLIVVGFLAAMLSREWSGTDREQNADGDGRGDRGED